MLQFCRMVCSSCRFLLSCCGLTASYCMSNMFWLFLPSGRGRWKGNSIKYFVTQKPTYQWSICTRRLGSEIYHLTLLSLWIYKEPWGSHKVLSEGLCQVLLAHLLLSSSCRPIPMGWIGMIQQHLLYCPVQPSMVQVQDHLRGDIQSMERQSKSPEAQFTVLFDKLNQHISVYPWGASCMRRVKVFRNHMTLCLDCEYTELGIFDKI